MFHPKARIRIRVRPPSDIARRKYTRGTRLEEFVDDDSVVEQDPRACREVEIWADAYPCGYDVRIESRENRRIGVD